MNANCLLIVMAKNPVLGHVKTRLAQQIGNQAALHVYNDLLKITAKACEQVMADKWVAYSQFIQNDWVDFGFKVKLQQGTNLGSRMSQLMIEAFKDGYHQVIFIGTDCPSISGMIINQAFLQLNQFKAVIGPAYDGGYYLLGISQPLTDIFEGISWSTPLVFEQTIGKLTHLGLNYTVLEHLHDIDNLSDLKYMV